MIVRDGELAFVACGTSACGIARSTKIRLRCAAHDLVRHVGGCRQQNIHIKLLRCQNKLHVLFVQRHVHLFLVMHL